jgi:hypothetical protein
MRILASILFGGCVLATAQAANQVHVVDGDGGPGVDFVSLQTAVSTVADGDILLVRDCGVPYATANLASKSLTIVGVRDVNGDRPIARGLAIEDLGVAQGVVVRGLEFDALPQHFSTAFAVRDCAGSVFVEDCVLAQSAPDHVLALMVTVSASPRTVFTRCSITAQPNVGLPVGGFGAVHLENGSVSLYECALVGGQGRNAAVPLIGGVATPSSPGSAGLSIVTGSVFASGCTFVGGDGGNGAFQASTLTCVAAAVGGPAVVAQGDPSTRVLTILDSTFAVGASGVAAGSCPAPGVAPFVIDPAVTTSSVVGDIRRTFEVTSPSPEGQLTTTTLTGVPGEFALLLLAFSGNGAYTPAVVGALAGTPPLTVIALGALPPSGTLSFSVPIPVGGLPASIDGVNLYEQAVVAGASGFGLLSSPSVVTILR